MSKKRGKVDRLDEIKRQVKATKAEIVEHSRRFNICKGKLDALCNEWLILANAGEDYEVNLDLLALEKKGQ